jgi:hypothetical protein
MSNPLDLATLNDVRNWLALDNAGQPITSLSPGPYGGVGYPNSFTVTVTPVDGNGSGASITGTAVAGVVQTLTLVAGGKGYTQEPALTFPTGTGIAAVTAYIGPDLILARAITSCSNFIRNQTQRDDWASATYNEKRNGNGNSEMSLLHYPARLNDPNWSTTVNSVTINTLLVPPSPNGVTSGWANDQLSVYLLGSCYLGYGAYLGGAAGFFPKGFQNVAINYTCGYAATPSDISQAVIEAVCQKFRRRAHIDQDSVVINAQNINFSKKDFAPEVWTLIQQYKYIAPIAT